MPIQNGRYVSPTWHNNAPPALNAAELQAITNTIAALDSGVFRKQETLTAATAALYGMTATAVPNDILTAIQSRIAGSGGVWTLIQSYKTAGAYTFAVPAGVTRIGVYMIGGGGSGGVSMVHGDKYRPMASGGASGYGKNVIFDVVPGQTIQLVIGVAGEVVSVTGAGDQSKYGINGGTTSFNGVTAEGGGKGTGNYSVSPSVSSAIGGQASSGSGGSYASVFCALKIRYGNTPVWREGSYSSVNAMVWPQIPREGQNIFDPTMVTLCAGAGSYGRSVSEIVYESILPMPDGTSGGTNTHPDATGNGNGGYGASIAFDAGTGEHTTTSGAGSDGMVLIYKAGV